MSTLYVITGPTASGKTAMAIELAERLGTEIISADSRQIYRGIPITTAVPTAEEQARVKHHLIECLDLDDYYSAARFETEALAIARRLMAEHGSAVVCGGSMMYVDALTRGIDEMPTVSDAVRERVRELYAQHGMEGLLAMLEIDDPATFATIDRANTKRVMHALEITMQAGVPYSTLCRGERKEREFDIVKYAIHRERPELFDRINRRVDAMVAAGMEDEARSVYPLRHLNSLNTVGFKEWFAHFDGLMDHTTAIERIKKNTRVYAKKQLTWLKRDPSIHWLDASEGCEVVGLLGC